MLSNVCFFQSKRNHAPAVFKCQIGAESKHCVVWRGMLFDDYNVVGVGTYESNAEQMPSNL